MPRPRAVDLGGPALPWRSVPMPGANLPLDLVALESDGSGFTLLGRFPAGFVRDTPGGYLAAEEFVVLDGALELESRRHGPGTLVHVPAGTVRTDMRAPAGCTVLAWFDGPALFRGPGELSPGPARVTSVSLHEAPLGVVTGTAGARWRRGEAAEWTPGAEGLSLAGAWARTPQDWPATAAEPATLFRERG